MRLRNDLKDFRRPFVVLAVLAACSSFAGAQDVRGLGLGGALVPGPGLAAYNPAFAAYPSDGRGGGLVLPLGLLNFFINPQLNAIDFVTNPAKYNDPDNPNAPEFNVLAAFDQATHLNTLILNPVPAPRQINVNFSAGGVTLTDENGKPLETNFSSGFSTARGASAVGVSPLFRIAFGVGAVQFGLGVFISAGGPSLAIDPKLQADLLAGNGKLPPNTTYSSAVSGAAKASAGIAFDVGYAMPIPLPALPGATLYAGGRGSGFYGLALVEVSALGSLKTDSSGDLRSATPDYSVTVFRADPTNGGFGYGLNADLGAAVDLPGATLGVPELERLNVGLGIVGAIDYYSWTGTEQTTTSAGTSVPVASSRSGGGFDPLVTLNVAGTFSLANGLRVLALTDAQFGRGRLALHLGAETQVGPLTVRGGLGLDNGFKFGLGASFDVSSGFGLDVALTTHQAPFYNHTNFGIALAVRFGF